MRARESWNVANKELRFRIPLHNCRKGPHATRISLTPRTVNAGVPAESGKNDEAHGKFSLGNLKWTEIGILSPLPKRTMTPIIVSNVSDDLREIALRWSGN
jgi:hypothetical protein